MVRIPDGYVRGMDSLSTDFQTISSQGGIDFLCPSVDPAGEGEGFVKSVAAEPGAMVEDMASGVIVEDDALSGRSGEEGLLEFLGHE